MPEITDQQIEQLPIKKIREAFESCNGYVQFCPDCGNLTAFLGRTGMTDSSECHVCGYSRKT